MTKEQITAAAEERYPIVFDENKQPFHVMVRTEQRNSFTYGAEWAMKEMEKEAQEFAEWCSLKGYLFAFISSNRSVPPMWFLHGQLVTTTTSELFQIYKQHKP